MTKLQAISYNLNELNKKNKVMQDAYKTNKKIYEDKIKNIFGKKDLKTYDFKESNTYYKATLVEPKKIEFNADMIEQIVDKEIFDEICEKKYEIIDYVGMVEYLKTLGAKPKDFKKFIHCEKTINKNKVDQLGDLGDLSLDDLEGCYTLTKSSAYVKITESEEEIPDE